MSSPLDASERNGTPHGRSVRTVFTDRSKPYAVYDIAEQRWVPLAKPYWSDDYAVHTSNRRRANALVAIFAAACAGLVALVVYRLASMWAG